MTDPDQPLPKRPRGRPRKYGKRQNFSFRLTDEMREVLVESAAKAGRSLSEEIEFRLNRDFGWEASKIDLDEMKKRAAAWEDAARVKAIRAAGLQILREIEGRPTRVIVDLETLLAEADGLARGIRSGFFEGEAPPPVPQPRRMTIDEEQRLLEEIEQLKRSIAAMGKADDDKVA
jgi:hypothetical protein